MKRIQMSSHLRRIRDARTREKAEKHFERSCEILLSNENAGVYLTLRDRVEAQRRSIEAKRKLSSELHEYKQPFAY